VKVLVADDVGVTRRIIEETLRDLGHEVTGVADGAAAWQAFLVDRHPLVVTDWLMPGMDGLELCRRIRGEPNGGLTFLLIQTGRGTSDDLAVALAAGIDDYITKPVSVEQLRARVQIAERRMAQEGLRRSAEEALAHGQWLAGIGETALALQHEVRSPLTALLGELEMGLDSSDPAEHREALVAAAEQTRRIADIIRRLATLRDPGHSEKLPGFRMIDLSAPKQP
jgi:DNA-binding response OmpR family regulator